MSFMCNLRKYRELAGISSAKDMSALLGIPYPTYLGYENKNAEPKFDVLCEIASILGVSIDTLLDHETNSFDTARYILKDSGLDILVDNDGSVHIKEGDIDFCQYDNITDFKEAVLSMHKAFNGSELRREAEHNFILAQIAKGNLKG